MIDRNKAHHIEEDITRIEKILELLDEAPRVGVSKYVEAKHNLRVWRQELRHRYIDEKRKKS